VNGQDLQFTTARFVFGTWWCLSVPYALGFEAAVQPRLLSIGAAESLAPFFLLFWISVWSCVLWVVAMTIRILRKKSATSLEKIMMALSVLATVVGLRSMLT
jgi:hypothetical protein